MTKLLSEIFARCVVTASGCWEFQGYLDPKGYGRINRAGWGSNRLAHRVSYSEAIGPIPEGLELDHVCHSNDLSCSGGMECRHRRCCNPEHLEAVTHKVNVNRAMNEPPIAAVKRAMTHCSKGHEYTPENTRWRTDGRRRCRTCAAAWQRAKYNSVRSASGALA